MSYSFKKISEVEDATSDDLETLVIEDGELKKVKGGVGGGGMIYEYTDASNHLEEYDIPESVIPIMANNVGTAFIIIDDRKFWNAIKKGENVVIKKEWIYSNEKPTESDFGVYSYIGNITPTDLFNVFFETNGSNFDTITYEMVNEMSQQMEQIGLENKILATFPVNRNNARAIFSDIGYYNNIELGNNEALTVNGYAHDVGAKTYLLSEEFSLQQGIIMDSETFTMFAQILY